MKISNDDVYEKGLCEFKHVSSVKEILEELSSCITDNCENGNGNGIIDIPDFTKAEIWVIREILDNVYFDSNLMMTNELWLDFKDETSSSEENIVQQILKKITGMSIVQKCAFLESLGYLKGCNDKFKKIIGVVL